MYKNLPFVIPENDWELNLLLVLLVIYHLHTTSRGKNIIDIERLNIYIYLVKNPHILHKVLIRLSKNNFLLKSYEVLSFKADRNDSETLCRNKILKYYIQILLANSFIKVKYDEKIGFVFIPTNKAENYINFEDKYLNRVIIFIEKIEQINSIPVSKINLTIRNILSERF